MNVFKTMVIYVPGVNIYIYTYTHRQYIYVNYWKLLLYHIYICHLCLRIGYIYMYLYMYLYMIICIYAYILICIQAYTFLYNYIYIMYACTSVLNGQASLWWAKTIQNEFHVGSRTIWMKWCSKKVYNDTCVYVFIYNILSIIYNIIYNII